MKRVFVDAPDRERCKAIVKLRDGTTANCGRRAVQDGLCTQHYKIAQRDAALRSSDEKSLVFRALYHIVNCVAEGPKTDRLLQDLKRAAAPPPETQTP